jgi:hypothetical protein
MDRLIQDVLTYSRVTATNAARARGCRRLINAPETYPQFKAPQAQLKSDVHSRVMGNEAVKQCLSNLIETRSKCCAGRRAARWIWAKARFRVRLYIRDTASGSGDAR